MSRERLMSTDSAASSEADRPPHQEAHMANTNLEYLSLLNIFTPASNVRNTGIICTIGPACNNVDMLVNMIENGMCVARLNFSHGTHEYHAETIANVKKAVNSMPGRSVAVALDTKGPEIRTGLLKGSGTGEIELKVGSVIKLSTDEQFSECGNQDCIFVDYKNLPSIVSSGDRIFIDDGLISVKVTDKSATHVTAVVQNGGKLGSRKGVNLPGKIVDLPPLSDKDKADLKFGVEHGVDSLFASFIRKASDIEDIRKELGPNGKHIFIIAKIENEEGVRNFDEILAATDGIMVARGDLGIEIPAEKVFLAQKMMIGRCNRAGKPVFVATQMLESMVDKPRPTRAEASDVANAVLDGADCVMLSGETAKGKYPVEAVRIMSRICLEAEAALYHKRMFHELRELTPKPTTTMQTTCIAAVEASFSQDAAAILTLTSTGKTAFILAKYRPRCPILAITREAKVARLCHMHRAIHPFLYTTDKDEDWAVDTEKRFMAGVQKGQQEGYIAKGSTIIVLSGWKPGPAHTNTIRILKVD